MPDNGACRVDTEAGFLRLLDVERQRAERSGRPFILVRIQISEPQPDSAADALLGRVSTALRETDWVAWRDGRTTLSAVCTELGTTDPLAAAEVIRQRLAEQLAGEPAGKNLHLSLETVLPRPAAEANRRASAEAMLAS